MSVFSVFLNGGGLKKIEQKPRLPSFTGKVKLKTANSKISNLMIIELFNSMIYF